jgi:hypothetical protein
MFASLKKWFKNWSPWHLRATVRHYEETLQDMKDSGVRFDMNPTKSFSMDFMKNESWWHEYIRKIDLSVRDRAANTLSRADAPLN